MKLNLIRTIVLAGFTVAVPVVPALAAMVVTGGSIGGAAPSVTTQVASKFECFTDDGYGRMFPCSARYKRENPAWRQSNQCFTDEGYGRYSPCSTFLKRTQTKN